MKQQGAFELDAEQISGLEAWARAVTCSQCGNVGLRIDMRAKLIAKPIGTFSLAGQQMKVSAASISWPWLVCPACGAEAEGEFGDKASDKDGVRCDRAHALPIHRTEAGYPNCATCDGGGCLDCTDPAGAS